MNGASTKDRIDAAISRRLVLWVGFVCERAVAFTTILLLATLLLAGYAATHLGINSDNVSLLAEDLPARVIHKEFSKLFPNLEDGMFVVVDAETPELSRDSADALATRLSTNHELFDEVYLPGGGTFFESNGLLYRSVDELDDFGDQMARMQPIIAELERDPGIANMASLITQGLEAARDEGIELSEWPDVLDRVGTATLAVFAEFPVAISWEEMLLKGSSIESVTRRVIVVHPKLDFENPFAAARPIEFIRDQAADLGLLPAKGVTVRVTGNPALNYEELWGMFWDLGMGGAVCFFIVIGILYLALRSLRLVLACVISLLVGLIWTAAFGAFAIGHLNLVSLAFGVLFIGLGVDFGIHLGMRYGDLMRQGLSHREALAAATESVGSSLLTCAITTAIGFFVFIPTDYLGVAELGLIAGVGMFIIFVHTLTLLPALLSCVFHVDGEVLARKSFRFAHPWWEVPGRHPRIIIGVAAVLGLASLLGLPRLRFDPNVIKMRNPTAESVQAFNDLLEQAGAASPWFMNAIAANLEEAGALADRFEELPAVEMTITLNDYVPDDQEQKIEILEDIAFMLDAPGASGSEEQKISVEEQIGALRDLRDFLALSVPGEGGSPLGDSMRILMNKLDVFLERVADEQDPQAALDHLESILLSDLPRQIGRLRKSLRAEPFGLEDLPKELVHRMLTPDGRARIQIFPRETMRDEASFSRFVRQTKSIDPRATGVAANLLGFGEAVRDSFQQALISAIVVIWLLLWFLWRRVKPVLLAIAPLFLSSLLTCAVMAIFDIPFQFGNVIVIPLLLGIGIDSGIHLVHRSESLESGGESLMGTTTARAVFFSALTTTISFGSLALSSHRGMQSLGVLLSIGMVFTVLCNLLVLPALIQLTAQDNKEPHT